MVLAAKFVTILGYKCIWIWTDLAGINRENSPILNMLFSGWVESLLAYDYRIHTFRWGESQVGNYTHFKEFWNPTNPVGFGYNKFADMKGKVWYDNTCGRIG